MIFLGASRTQPAARARECGGWMRAPMLALAGVCAAIGLMPVLFWPAVSRAVAGWHPAWAAPEPSAPLAMLGWAQVILAIVIVAAATCLWLKSCGSRLRRAATWDCGYAAPAARMQYTSASFAGIASGWFRWVLQPERRVRRPRGNFPVEAIRLEHIPETVLERLIGPAGLAILQISSGARRLQHGRLQFYILYVVVGLIALGALVIFGGSR